MERKRVGQQPALLYFKSMYYIYILYSESSDKYYVGYTDDPARRVIEHNTKPFNTYTSKHRPWKLVASFPAGESRSEAVKIERYIKKQKSRTFILKLIAHQQDPEQIALLVRVPTSRD
jgi:putative endonuclease